MTEPFSDPTWLLVLRMKVLSSCYLGAQLISSRGLFTQFQNKNCAGKSPIIGKNQFEMSL